MTTRNLVICMVPTVLAFFAIYWLKKKKKTKLPSSSVDEVQEENKPYLECNKSSSESAPSELDNTLSDASSFSSPVSSSEKSSKSPLFDSPLHVAADGLIQSDLILPNCFEKSPYASKNVECLRIEELKNDAPAASEQTSEPGSLIFENNSVSSKYKTLQSPNVKNQSINFFESGDLFLPEEKESDSTNQILDFNSSFEKENNNPENCLQAKVIESENLDNLTALISGEDEKVNEIDGHSSAFDENSLSYVSDDSEGKQFADECKNIGSLSSVLDENSLMSSFCDELEKSSVSNSPIAVTWKSNYFGSGSDSSKDILNLLSIKDSSINYTDSYAESLKESNLDKYLGSTTVLVNDSPDQHDSYKIIENIPFLSETYSKSNIKAVDENQPGLNSYYPKENEEAVDNINIELVQNNLSSIKGPSLISNDKLISDSKALNIDTLVEKEQISCSVGAEATSNDHYSSEKGCNNVSSFQDNRATYASILNSNKNNLISVQKTSSSISNCNDTVNQLLKSNSDWPLPNNKAVSESNNSHDLCSASRQTYNVNNEILPSNGSCEVETNCDSVTAEKTASVPIAANRNSPEKSTSLHQKESLLESSSEEGHKAVKQRKLENFGFLDPKTQSSKEFVYEFELPQELCGRLIGKHGRNVKSIMEQSNANVFIKHHPYDPLLKVVVVEGHRSDVNEALEIIRRKYPPSMFPAVTLVQTNMLSSTGVPMPESLQWSRLYFSYLLPSPCSYIFNSCVVNFAELMSICVTQLHLPEGASCDVILSSLVSAGHFFLQQPTHPTYPSLSTLDQCMINLYSQMDTPLLPQPIEAGVICAAPVFRGWYRAQVVYICDNSSDGGIKFVDYGGFSQVPISSLRQIRSDFMSLPFQASECYLARVRPLGCDTWSTEATSVFEELAQGQILQALLVEYADDGIPCVYLYRVQGVSSTFINKELVERGLAEWVGNSNHWDPH